MKKIIHVFAFSLVASGAPAAASSAVAGFEGASAQDQGQAVAAELERRNSGYRDMSANIQMVLRNGQGQESKRAMRIRSLEKPQGDYSLIVFDTPADVRGTALLSHAGLLEGDEHWLYMPALERVRRISSKNTSGPFMGSEFSYEDITGNEVDKYSWTLLAKEACGAAQCFKLETRPKYERSGYSKRIVWVDATDYRIQKIEFYDQRESLLKTLVYGGYEKYQNKFWRAHQWTMTNHQSGKSTVLTFGEYKFGNGFTDDDFTKAALERLK